MTKTGDEFAVSAMMMILTDEEERIYERFQDLCSDLNLDSSTKDTTWSTYAGVRQNYTLEVSKGFSNFQFRFRINVK